MDAGQDPEFRVLAIAGQQFSSKMAWLAEKLAMRARPTSGSIATLGHEIWNPRLAESSEKVANQS